MCFKENMGLQFACGWMQKGITLTMEHLKCFTPDGELYCELIQKHFLDDRPLTESEIDYSGAL